VITLTFERPMDNEKPDVDWGLKELKLLVLVIVPNTTPLIENPTKVNKYFLYFIFTLPPLEKLCLLPFSGFQYSHTP